MQTNYSAKAKLIWASVMTVLLLILLMLTAMISYNQGYKAKAAELTCQYKIDIDDNFIETPLNKDL